MEEENKYGLNIRRHKQHNRKIPWTLIRKIVIVLILIGLLYYLRSTLNDETEIDLEGVGIELDTSNNEPVESPDL